MARLRGGVGARARAWLLAVIAVALVALGLLAAVATAASPPRVLAPSASRVVGAAELTATVRAGRHLRVYVGSRDVTRRFGKPVAGVRSARLRRGRDFKLGLNRIVLAAGKKGKRRYVSRTFLAARPARLLSLRRRTGPGSLAPLELSGRSRAPIDRLLVSLNGKRLRQRALLSGERRSFRLRLGLEDGLEYGRNVLVVQATATGGKRFSRLTRVIRLPRRAPLPGAGRDRRATVGRALRLDAGATKRSRRGSRLGFHWRIVSAPRGSKAALVHAASKRPRLVPDRPGRYLVQLVSTEHRRGDGRRPGAATASAAPPRASDVMAVEAAPPTPPLGVPIETLLPGGGVSLAGQALATKSDWLQVVVVDRSTLEVVSNTAVEAEVEGQVGAASLAELNAAIEAANPADLVVLSGGGHPIRFAGFQQLAELGAVLAEIGVSPQAVDTTAAENAIGQGQWSAVGVPGSAAGSGTANLRGIVTGGFGNQLPAGSPGSLQGYLQLSLPPVDPASSVLGGGYSFVSADHAAIDTEAAAGGAGVSSIEVAGQAYTTAALPAGASGFHLLVLGDRLEAVSNQAFITNDPGGGANAPGVGALDQALTELARGPGQGGLLVLQSIGTPGGANSQWVADVGIPAYPWSAESTVAGKPLVGNEPSDWSSAPVGVSLAAAIGELAGPAAHDQFAQLVAAAPQPTPGLADGYTLVAPLGEPEAAVYQSAKGSELESAQVVGTLTRTATAGWQVENPTSTDAFDGAEVMAVAYQAPTPWPDSGRADLRASRWIAEQLGLSAGGVSDVRQAYYVHDDDDWLALRAELRDLRFETGNGFGEDEFEDLREQLLVEFPYVAAVRSAVAEWQSVFNRAGHSGLVDLQYVTAQVEDEIDQAIASRQATLNGNLVAAHSLGIAAGLLGAGGLGPVAGPIGAISSGLMLSSDLSQGAGGSLSALPVHAEAAKLGVELAVRYEEISENLSHVGDILVSDWGKLQTAAKAVNGAWAVSEAGKSDLARVLTIGADREAYAAMLPLAYGEYLLAPQATQSNAMPSTEPWTYSCVNDSFESGRTRPLAGAEGNPGSWIAYPFELEGDAGSGFTTRLQPRVMAIEADITENEGIAPVIKHEPDVLPPTIGGKLFGSLQGGGLGLDQVAFFGNPAFERWPLYC